MPFLVSKFSFVDYLVYPSNLAFVVVFMYYQKNKTQINYRRVALRLKKKTKAIEVDMNESITIITTNAVALNKHLKFSSPQLVSGLFSYIVHIYEKAAYELQEEQIAIAFARAFDLPARHKLPRSKKKT
ncbi:hypothetical protein V8B55DRAFT_1586688 [Mucor lusitanicus]